MTPPPPPAALAIDVPGEALPRRRQSLAGAYRSIAVPRVGSAARRFMAFVGPGYLIAVGYMDPGNWATDLAGGSRFGFALLSVIAMSSLMAMLLQALSAKLGIVAGMDLAQACRERYSVPVRTALWLLCELAIVACDLAEVIGSAVALKLLFSIPLAIGVWLTGFGALLMIALERSGFRRLEAAIAVLTLVVAVCLGAELLLSGPAWGEVGAGLVPQARIVSDPVMLTVAVGILGATVMPHNLYLHSALVQTRRFRRNAEGKREALRFATIDSTVALSLAFLVNASILILAGATFHAQGRTDVVDLGSAYELLAPMLGTGAASLLFGIALLASGQNSTVTGTLAGQIVMEGFTDFRMSPTKRRILSRLLAIVPAALVATFYGDAGTGRLLILSQVALSLQLPFAMVPLVRLTADRRLMGEFANRGWLQAVAWLVAAVIIALNVVLLAQLV